MGNFGVFRVHFVSETAEVELKSERVKAPAPKRMTDPVTRCAASVRPQRRVIENNHSPDVTWTTQVNPTPYTRNPKLANRVRASVRAITLRVSHVRQGDEGRTRCGDQGLTRFIGHARREGAEIKGECSYRGAQE